MFYFMIGIIIGYIYSIKNIEGFYNNIVGSNIIRFKIISEYSDNNNYIVNLTGRYGDLIDLNIINNGDDTFTLRYIDDADNIINSGVRDSEVPIPALIYSFRNDRTLSGHNIIVNNTISITNKRTVSGRTYIYELYPIAILDENRNVIMTYKEKIKNYIYSQFIQ